ncbi:MAG: hypothetical protein MK212_07870 [Saprospiraceae bacterium]|nr:hypothetical protein [Saprospiraceae bacterium]
MPLHYFYIFTLSFFLIACGRDQSNTNTSSVPLKDIPTLIKDLDEKFPEDAKPTIDVECKGWESIYIFSIDGKNVDKVHYDYAVSDGSNQFFYYQGGKLAAVCWQSAYARIETETNGRIEIYSEITAYSKEGKLVIKNLEGEISVDNNGNRLGELVMKETPPNQRTKELITAIYEKLSPITETRLKQVGEAICIALNS